MKKYKIDELHESFPNSDVRKTLSRMAYKAFLYLKPEDIKKQIKELEDALEESEKAHAALKLIKAMDWKEHDFSDETGPAPDDNYYSFVGTDEEAKQVKKELHKLNAKR